MIDFSEQTFGVRICPNPRLQLCLIRFPGAAAVVIHSKTVNGVALTCSELAASAAIDAGELFRLQREGKRDGPRHTQGAMFRRMMPLALQYSANICFGYPIVAVVVVVVFHPGSTRDNVIDCLVFGKCLSVC